MLLQQWWLLVLALALVVELEKEVQQGGRQPYMEHSHCVHNHLRRHPNQPMIESMIQIQLS